MSAGYANTSPANRDAMALTRRYKDAYRVANVVVGAGNLIKGIGIVVAIIIALGSFALGTQANGDTGMAIMVAGVAFAVVVGLMLFIGGVLTAAQGQVLQASLDSAVNSSPFLNNDHRKDILALSQSQATDASVLDSYS
jgi:hypothetical protein